mmetsp:Transcript_64064/g.139339  ORF Transcript_64064/g.139339 Transcript_64064/m.139339 type:complete len:202 (+) Transcript_64064:223-828(+)
MLRLPSTGTLARSSRQLPLSPLRLPESTFSAEPAPPVSPAVVAPGPLPAPVPASAEEGTLLASSPNPALASVSEALLWSGSSALAWARFLEADLSLETPRPRARMPPQTSEGVARTLCLVGVAPVVPRSASSGSSGSDTSGSCLLGDSPVVPASSQSDGHSGGGVSERARKPVFMPSVMHQPCVTPWRLRFRKMPVAPLAI